MSDCKNCGKNIDKDNEFCSSKCYYDSKNLEKTCPGCGEIFKTPKSVDSKFCTRECSINNKKYIRGEESNLYKGGKIEKKCNWCEEMFKVWPKNNKQKYCSQNCMAKAFSDGRLKADNHPRWVGYKQSECAFCGENFKFKSWLNRKFCSRKCSNNYQSKELVGENHPNWSGGKAEYYGENWVRQRRKALDRDNYSCKICGKSKKEIGREPSVHHIKPISEFNNLKDANKLDNLICVCTSHHHKIEGWNLIPSNIKD